MKNNWRLQLLAAGIALSAATQVYAQADIHFSQFYETSILRNPSLTGIFTNDYKVGAYYRNQWSSISNPYITTLVYAEVRMPVGHVSDDYISLGFLGYSDKAGSIDQKITSLYPAINYSKCVNTDRNAYLSVGFTSGYTQYSFDASKVTTNHQYLAGFGFDPTLSINENFTNTKMTMWDLGAGINYNSSTGSNNSITYILGVSGYHLTQPTFSYYAIPGITQNMRWNLNGAIGFNVQSNITTQIHTNLALQGAYTESITGLLINYAEPGGGSRPAYVLTGGVFYRYLDAVVPVVRLKYKNTSIGASYDVNISKLKQASKLRGGYEITMSISGDWSNKTGEYKKTVCPKF